jgi:hypothetical protein
LFTNIGKINSGFYNSADQSIDTLVNLQLPGAIDNSIPNVVREDIPGRLDEVKVTAPKDTSLGVVVSNTTADLARIINEVPEDRKNAANDFYTLLTGGPFGFVTNKAIEKGVSLLPQPVLQSMGEAGEKFNETIGRAGTGVLLGVSQDQVKESQTSGNERTQDRVDGAAMVGGAALDVTVGVVVGGVAIAVSKAKKAKHKVEENNGQENNEVSVEAGSRSENKNANVEKLLVNGKVPSSRDGKFKEWFDALSAEELGLLWQDPSIRRQIESRIREPGGFHEWCMVCRAPDFKDWGVSMEEIQRFRTRTESLKWINPNDGTPGGHGKAGSGVFHNELKSIIDSSSSLKEFNERLLELTKRWNIDPNLLPPFPKRGNDK